MRRGLLRTPISSVQAAILEHAIADSVSLTAATSINAQRRVCFYCLCIILLTQCNYPFSTTDEVGEESANGVQDAALLQIAVDSSGIGGDDGTGKENVEDEEEEEEEKE